MLYETRPNDFKPSAEAVGCFIEKNGKILLLHRQNHKPEGGTWGLPSGKVEEGEDLLQAIQREVVEETGFEIPKSSFLHLKTIFVRYPDYDFVYHIFRFELKDEKKVEIREDEHKNFEWEEPKNALKKNLIRDLDRCIELFYDV